MSEAAAHRCAGETCRLDQHLKHAQKRLKLLLGVGARDALTGPLDSLLRLVGLSLGELLHVVTGVDRDALLSATTLSFPVTFESMDIADARHQNSAPIASVMNPSRMGER